MKTTLFTAVVLLPLFAGTAWAEPPSPLIQAFAQSAGMSNAFEIAEANMALDQSTDRDIRAFARRMIHDHTIAQRTLRRAAAEADVVADVAMEPAAQSALDALNGKTGADFDAAYLADQKDAHASAVATLGDYAENGEDPALREWARMNLPVVEMHERMVDNMTAH